MRSVHLKTVFFLAYLLDKMAAPNMEFGGYDVETKSDTNYECPICKMIIRQFTELPCHHFACRACLELWEKQQREKHQRQLQQYELYFKH